MILQHAFELPVVDIDISQPNELEACIPTDFQLMQPIIMVPDDLQESLKPSFECRKKEWKFTQGNRITKAQQTKCCKKICCSKFNLADIKHEWMKLHSNNEQVVKQKLEQLIITDANSKERTYFLRGKVCVI